MPPTCRAFGGVAVENEQASVVVRAMSEEEVRYSVAATVSRVLPI
jgi:hypothetical protein